MKKIFLFFYFLVCAWLVQAQQVSPEMQKKIDDAQKKMQEMQNDPALQAKMQRAQKLMDSLNSDPKNQQKMQQAQQQLDALKKDHPELSGVNIPDLSKSKVTDIHKILQNTNDGLKSSMANMQSIQQSIMGALPKEDLSRHASTLPILRTIDIKALAQGIVNSSTVDMMTKQNFNKLAKDTTVNVAGTGIFYLSMGLPTDASGYLIAKGVLLHPSDPYAVSGLGVYYRDANTPDRALQCFFYANKMLPDSLKSPYVYANIAWASAYYGDFSTAKTYFEKALTLSSSFQPALEGEATLAYAKGDIKALFACLAKELLAMTKTAGGGSGGGGGPSGDFTSTCGGAGATERMNDAGSGTKSDPSDDHTFDGLGDDDDGPDQDPPPGGDVTYPEIFKPVFVNNIRDVINAIDPGKRALIKGGQILGDLKNKYIGIKARFYGVSYFDEHGDLRHDRDYTKFANLHGQINMQFESRVSYHIDEFEKDFTNYFQQVKNGYIDRMNQIAACKNDECLCIAYNQVYTEGNNFLNNGATLWEKMFDKVHSDMEWYLKNDAAFITRVHDPKCNEALNVTRELKIRAAILRTYGRWFDILGALEGYSALSQITVKCPPVKMGMMGNPDPFSKRPKHIKEFPDKNCKDIEFPIGILGTITENCQYTKFTIGPKFGSVQLGLSYTTNKDALTGQVKDPINSQNNNFDHSYSASVGVGTKFGDIIEVSATGTIGASYGNDGKATGYTSGIEGASAVDFGVAKLGGKASRTCQWDTDFNVTGYSNNVSESGSIGGNTNNLGPNQPESAPGAVAGGPSLNSEFTSISSYDANGNYIGGSRSANFTAQASATSDDKGSPTEVSGQNSIFGIQFNQVIEVVDGQKKSAPMTIDPK
jgi:tetratricopeptide (TPR) repeat protein